MSAVGGIRVREVIKKENAPKKRKKAKKERGGGGGSASEIQKSTTQNVD